MRGKQSPKPKSTLVKTDETATVEIGTRIKVHGHIANWREHGQIVFCDLRQENCILQTVIPEALITESGPWREACVELTGILTPRKEGTENESLLTGKIELQVDSFRVISKSQVLPYELTDQTSVDEALRLKWRAYDLRSPLMQEAIRTRSQVTRLIRNELETAGFMELETPQLTMATSGGAREFKVPSYQHDMAHYALPQSPQVYKQLYMCAGFEKYYQIVRCFRDEAARSDRQPEFTQIDLEWAYTTAEQIQSLVEKIVRSTWQYSQTALPTGPFKRITYQEAMESYGSDKPDLRYPWKITSFRSQQAELPSWQEGEVYALATSGEFESAQEARQITKELQGLGFKQPVALWKVESEWRSTAKVEKLGFESFEDLVKAAGGSEDSSSLLILSPSGKTKQVTLERLGIFRSTMTARVKPSTDHSVFWLVDPPMFELNEEGQLTSLHHPFTRPTKATEGLLHSDPLSMVAEAYDLVLDGHEVGGGSLRVHEAGMQREILSALGIGKEQMEKEFDWLLRHLDTGAPPHGGLALGLDRLLMLILKRKTLRDVIAFPKGASGQDPLTGAPVKE